MKVLMVHPHEVYSSLEPWTVRIVSLAKELVKKGHEVKIAYFPLKWEAGDSGFLKDDIRFYPFCRRSGIHTIAHNCLKLSPLADWADIIHFQKCFHYAALPAVLNGFFKGKPLHYDWDDWEEMIYYDSARPPVKTVGLFLRMLERNLPHLSQTVSVSSLALRDLCLENGIGPGSIFHVPVGADLDAFNPGVSGERVRDLYGIHKPLVLYLGQLHGGQYVELFIQAAKIILDGKTDVQFMVVGGGVREADLKAYARRLRLGEKIIFTGPIDAGEVPEYIAGCDVAVACFEDNPITRCKSPLKIAEYLAGGKPIVASAVGEVREMVKDAGILVKAGHAGQLAEKILFVLSDKKLREELAVKARRRAEDTYNWGNSAQTLLKAYNAALGLP